MRQKEQPILTPINEATVVLLIRLAAIAFSLELDRGDTFRLSMAIVGERNFTKRSNSRMEKFLKRDVSATVQSVETITTNLDLSLVHVVR